MEGLIRDHVMQHIETNKLVSFCQHGFVGGRSCSTQLTYCLDIWMKLLDEGASLDVAYLDFAKAFDSVPHRRLLRKLQTYGFTHQLLKWSEGFLTGRRQRVMVNGEASSWSEVLSGVPQGSVLGPLYFVLFINDMPEVVHNYIALFADDAKLFSRIETEEDYSDMQQDLVLLQEWAQKWQLNFNATKCKVLQLGRQNPKHRYKMSGHELGTISEEKDLGVMIDDQLKFDVHTERQVAKANKQLGLIRRSFDSLDSDSFTLLYKSLVRTHLEYCNAVSYPIYDRQERLLEGVQRRATKLVPGVKHLDYTDRLKKLHLPSLYYRRARGDIIEVFKYVRGVYKVESCPFQLDDNPVTTRGHKYKLKKPRCNKPSTQKFFTYRAINAWNNLPEEVVDAPTLNTLKNRLDAHWKPFHYSLEPFQQPFPAQI